MTDNYFALAKVYDTLNAEIDYAKWAKYIDEKIKKHSEIDVSLVLDLCAGTGSMTMALDALGYDMTAVDLSPEMLDIAREKAIKAGREKDILFLCQNMCSFELFGTVQAVVSCLDSLNHLDSESDLEKVFRLVHNYLESGGIFCFDMNSEYKFENIYADNAYVLEDEGIYCGWQNQYDRESRICEFFTSIFVENEDGSYERFDDYEREYCFSHETVEKLLKKCGFEVISVESDTDSSPVTDESDRLYYTVRKI